MILDSITDGMFTLDEEMNFTYVNKAFEKISNTDKRDFIGHNYWEKFPDAKELRFYDEYTRAMKKNVSVHFDEYATSLDKWVSVNAYPRNGGLTVFFTDISEKIKQLSVIEGQNTQLREIANILSHEIRKPVATIQGLFQLIDMDNYSTPENKDIITKLLPVISELNDMIDIANSKTKLLGIDDKQ